MRLLKRWRLQNGLEVEAMDLSENYWADFWNLKILIRARVEVPEGFGDPLDPLQREALRRLGKEVLYQREIVKVGVRERDLEDERRKVLKNFEENALGYLAHPAFPRRFLQKKLEETLERIKIERRKEEEARG